MLVFFATTPPPLVIMGVVAVLGAAIFLPLRFIYPVRTRRWRKVSLPVAVAWTVFAFWSALAGFDPGALPQVGLVATSLYLLGAGIAQQVGIG